ncbi:MAG: NADH-quinone oxidoreductase subunit NuoF [Anaerolineales bacterium]|nr:NADH-quinone oxidoreductase subunit NuoF [Anaerolineales bacterium]
MTPESLTQVAEKERASSTPHSLQVCTAAGCVSSGADEVLKALKAEAKARGVACQVKGVGCLGMCQAGPLVAAEPSGHLHKFVTPTDAAEMIAHLGEPPTERLALDADQAFFKRQEKIVLENSGSIDAERIEEYVAAGGYKALAEALSDLTPSLVIKRVTASGLRGRGGAGFPTGVKWATVAKAAGPRKFVVCNADEGDPGAFMDRSVLESDPHRVLEGMAIAAFAVGAHEGYLYVRAEYPLAVKRLKLAIKQAERLGVLGRNILETGFDFHVEVRLGAGAFVCGEETALIASIQGGRGNPRPRPPFPAERGLWHSPTLINNVETFANIPTILRKGAEWFASIGTEKSKGTKVFALAGAIRNTGLVEVPMGITLREIVYDIGGGIPGDRTLKAVQTGGPSGGCIPAEFIDQPVDYETLNKLGSIMGSGGMIVIDDSACMVDVARFFMEFCMTESCGKCVPCRAGTVQIHGLLTKIARGEAGLEDLDRLETLSTMVKRSSLCGLGQSAPNPVLSTLRYFRDEYLAHVVDHRCPAGVCKIAAEGEVIR